MGTLPATSALVNKAKTVVNAAAPVVGGLLAAGGVAAIAAASKTPEVMVNSKYINNKFNVVFPNDLVTDKRNFYIALQFMEYQRRSIFNQPFLNALGGIRLPIPNNLVDTQAVEYSQDSDAVTGAAIEQGLKGRNTLGSSDGASIIQGAVAAAGGGLAAKALGAVTGVASQVGNVNQGLQLMGLAQNPFLTVLFKQPAFKRHQFSWKLTPNNEQESNTIREIIAYFRSNMLPAMAPSAGGTLLKYPNMVIIELKPDDTFLYKFKPCVIENMSVNFASAGTPSFFQRTNAPTDVTITISLMEIEYWLKENVEDPGGTYARNSSGTIINAAVDAAESAGKSFLNSIFGGS